MNINDQHTLEQVVKLEKELREIGRALTQTRYWLNEAVAHDVDGAEDALYCLEDFEAETNITIDNIARAISRYEQGGV